MVTPHLLPASIYRCSTRPPVRIDGTNDLLAGRARSNGEIARREHLTACVWRITDFPRISNSPHTGSGDHFGCRGVLNTALYRGGALLREAGLRHDYRFRTSIGLMPGWSLGAVPSLSPSCSC